MDRDILQTLLKSYKTVDISEESFSESFIHLLSHEDAFQRTHLPGHITGSAWIVDKTGKYVLLTHHAKLNRWLQPGGHADGDENVLRVAHREGIEETGLSSLHLLHEGIFDLDIHLIPERKEFPEHLHYDIRFIFRGDMQSKLMVTSESHALSWIPMPALVEFTNNNESIVRMARKSDRLF
jgi:8-oxo-dGTP pyrophosphatase MutT (NUDIX family)